MSIRSKIYFTIGMNKREYLIFISIHFRSQINRIAPFAIDERWNVQIHAAKTTRAIRREIKASSIVGYWGVCAIEFRIIERQFKDIIPFIILFCSGVYFQFD